MKTKTVAELKRTLQKGQIWSVENGDWKPGPRKLVHIDSVKFGFETIKKDGSLAVSYCDWPKASELKELTSNSFTIHAEGFPYPLIYTLETTN